MTNMESREQALRKIEFYIPLLTDRDLRIVAAFMRGLTKGDQRT